MFNFDYIALLVWITDDDMYTYVEESRNQGIKDGQGQEGRHEEGT